MELKCVLQLAVLDGLLAKESPESLQDSDSPTAVVICTGGGKNRWQPEIYRILMRRNHNR